MPENWAMTEFLLWNSHSFVWLIATKYARMKSSFSESLPSRLALLIIYVALTPRHCPTSCRIPGYRVYKRRTSPLFPVHPAIYARLPYLVKLICFLELPLYNFLENDPNDPNELSLYEDPKYMLEPIPDCW